MTSAFRKDVARRLYGRSSAAKVASILLSSELHCVACYRFGQWGRKIRRRIGPVALPVLVVHRVWNRWCTHMHHCEIDPRAQIGPGLLIMHRTGIIIGPVVAGSNLTLHQNVTIGLRVAQGERTVPTLGHRVWIGPMATISGGITVGDRVTISAAAVLSKNIPAGCLVAGNPARVIARDYDSSPMMRSAGSGE